LQVSRSEKVDIVEQAQHILMSYFRYAYDETWEEQSQQDGVKYWTKIDKESELPTFIMPLVRSDQGAASSPAASHSIACDDGDAVLLRTPPDAASSEVVQRLFGVYPVSGPIASAFCQGAEEGSHNSTGKASQLQSGALVDGGEEGSHNSTGKD